MAPVSAAEVKRLRDLTGAGMMDCKKALEATDGDVEKAVELLRIKGQASAEKRAERSASNGLVAAHVADGVGTLVEVNCETDFVAKGDKFAELAQLVLDAAVAGKAATVEDLLASPVASGQSVAQAVTEASGTIGEKLEVRRVARLEAPYVAQYLHKTSPDLPPQIGVLVAADGAADVVRDVAMHAAAMKPDYLDRDAVPEEVVAAERRIAEEKSRAEGKPEQALPKIVQGRVEAFFRDRVLLEQKFAKDPSTTIAQLLKQAGVAAQAYVRFQVGT